MLSVPLYLQSIPNKEFERNLHTAGSYLLLAECSLEIHLMFSLFLLALYLLWDDFLISEMTSIQVNNMKTPCQPQSVHLLGMLIVENVTLPHLCYFRIQTQCKWDLRFSGGFYTALIGSFLPTFRENSWWLSNSHRGVGEDSSHQVCFALSTGQITFIFRTNSPRCTTFHQIIRNPSPVDRA